MVLWGFWFFALLQDWVRDGARSRAAHMSARSVAWRGVQRWAAWHRASCAGASTSAGRWRSAFTESAPALPRTGGPRRGRGPGAPPSPRAGRCGDRRGASRGARSGDPPQPLSHRAPERPRPNGPPRGGEPHQATEVHASAVDGEPGDEDREVADLQALPRPEEEGVLDVRVVVRAQRRGSCPCRPGSASSALADGARPGAVVRLNGRAEHRRARLDHEPGR